MRSASRPSAHHRRTARPTNWRPRDNAASEGGKCRPATPAAPRRSCAGLRGRLPSQTSRLALRERKKIVWAVSVGHGLQVLAAIVGRHDDRDRPTVD
jgi:hypothetical protein